MALGFFGKAIAMSALCLFGTTAGAVTSGTFVGYFGGNDSCTRGGISGAECIIKYEEDDGMLADHELGNGVSSGTADDFTIEVTEIDGSGEATAGTWTYTGAVFDLVYLAIKAGRGVELWDISGLTSGTFSTSDLLGNRAISHISFYGVSGVVPIPASLLLLLGGFGLLGAARMRRSA